MSHVLPDMEAVLPAAAAAVTHPGLVLTPEADGQAALLRRCQGGDDAAFEELVRRFQPRVSAIVRGILRQSNDCDDIAQQIFTKVYFALNKFNFQSAVSTWIYKIAVNECYDHLRKQKVRRAKILADLSEQESAWIENLDVNGHLGVASLAKQVEVRELADKLLARVCAEDRVLLILKEVEGYGVREVAAIVGLNENTVKVRLFRARQALLTALRRKRV
ncbi:MAG: sigma-70 family RNA polymerase sigma factor [Acidobacteria bacterium]|nr:MAG: sigma-70 family RNA polymerase sigma factor [Acidobacteriota bacterium]